MPLLRPGSRVAARNRFAPRQVKPSMTNPLVRIRFRRDHRWTPRHLSAYLDGELVERSRARIQRHVRDCPECHGTLRSLDRMLGLLQRLPPVGSTENPDIASAVRRRLHDSSPR